MSKIHLEKIVSINSCTGGQGPACFFFTDMDCLKVPYIKECRNKRFVQITKEEYNRATGRKFKLQRAS